MPTLAEFTLRLLRRRNEESGLLWTVFRFATVREFRAFRYEIQVEGNLDLAARSIRFKILGVQAPTNLMPGAGAAYKEISYAELEGEYRVDYAGAKQSGSFRFAVGEESLHILELSEGGGLRIEVEKGIENIRT